MSYYHTKFITTIYEFETVNRLYQTCFGKSAVPTEIQRAWWLKFNQGIIGLFENETLIGALSYWFLNKNGFELLLNGIIKESEINAAAIDPNHPKGIYISEIALHPEFRGKKLSYPLMQHFLSIARSQTKLPILALAYSKEGKILLEKEGFTLRLNSSQTQDFLDLYILGTVKK